MSIEDIEIEFWAHIYHEKLSKGMKPNEILESNTSTDFDADAEAQKEIERINELDSEDFETLFNDKAKR